MEIRMVTKILPSFIKTYFLKIKTLNKMIKNYNL